jgi:MoxR-like ATPase
VFTNLLLADEINRAPAKVQSALLEVMQEHQVTIGRETHRVPEPFLVLATQNPIETEGTYQLPEAQVDRFMLKVLVGYPSNREELVIVQRMTGSLHPPRQILSPKTSGDASRPSRLRRPGIMGYVVRLVGATRRPGLRAQRRPT